MIKKLFIALICLSAITFAASESLAASSSPLAIKLDKEEYGLNEEIKAEAVFTNILEKPLVGELLCDLSYIDNPNLYAPGPRNYPFSLKPGEQKVVNCTSSVTSGMPEGRYRLNIEVRDEYNNIIINNYEELLINGIEQQIQADMKVCADSECNNPKSVFMAGEDVYISLNTTISNPEISAQLKDGKGEKISDLQFIDNKANIKPEKAGGYIVSASISKKGMAGQVIEKDFAVIDAPAKIATIVDCNGNGKCDAGENIQNCPQDCTLAKTKSANLKYIITGIIILLLSAILIIIAYAVKKKKEYSNNNENQ